MFAPKKIVDVQIVCSKIIYLNEFVLYKPTEEVSEAFYLAHMKNEKWRADMGAIFIFPSMFKHYNFDERRK